jgi:hypothetical protein
MNPLPIIDQMRDVGDSAAKRVHPQPSIDKAGPPRRLNRPDGAHSESQCGFSTKAVSYRHRAGPRKSISRHSPSAQSIRRNQG